MLRPVEFPLELSDRQKHIVAAAVTVLSVATILAALAGVFWLIAVFVGRFSHIFLPVAVAGIGALVCDPYFDWLREKLRLPKPLALLVLFLSVLVPLVAFLWFFGAMLVRQTADVLEAAPAWWETVRAQVEGRWPQVQEFFNSPQGQQLREAVSSNSETIIQTLRRVAGSTLSAGADVARAVGAMAGWAVAPVYFAFFLLTPAFDLNVLKQNLPFFKQETREDVVFLIEEFVNIVVVFFRGQLIIAFLQGVLYAIGFSLVGLKFGFVLGLMLGFLNIIPYLGAMVGFVVTIPLAYFQPGGSWMMVAGVLATIAIVQTIESYVLTPRIMGDRTGLHPMVIIIAVFFWGSALGGIMGMILAIPLTAFAVVFWRLAREKYIDEWV
jgi:predicted PurR-regulated permease PerM